jgi:TRAP-type C4-dicarboxylate transport system permease small subunit
MALGKPKLAVIDRVADALLIGLSAAVVGIVLVGVVFRYVLNRSLPWTDEVVRYLFVWFTLLGAAVTLREREHIRVEYFVAKLPARARRLVEATVLVAVCAYLAALTVLGAQWVWATRGACTSALQWPLNLFFYAALPCSSALSLGYAIRRLRRGEFSERDVESDEVLAAAQEGEAPCRS